MEENSVVWKNFLMNKNEVSLNFPDPFESSLDSFDKIILIKTVKYSLLLTSI